MHLLQEGGPPTPLQGQKVDSCLTLSNELYEETHVQTKQEILLGRDTRAERGVTETRSIDLPCGWQSWVL